MSLQGESFERLFGKHNDWQSNACLNIGIKDPHFAYARGYKEAADCLVQNAVSLNKQDFFVYPICFLYRHYIELILKLIIKKAKELLDEDNIFPKGHSLSKLWIVAKDIIKKIWPEHNSKELSRIEEIILTYDSLDKDSQAFRYSKTKDGIKHLSSISRINLRALYESINEIAALFECMELELSRLMDIKYEMLNSL